MAKSQCPRCNKTVAFEGLEDKQIPMGTFHKREVECARCHSTWECEVGFFQCNWKLKVVA